MTGPLRHVAHLHWRERLHITKVFHKAFVKLDEISFSLIETAKLRLGPSHIITHSRKPPFKFVAS